MKLISISLWVFICVLSSRCNLILPPTTSSEFIGINPHNKEFSFATLFAFQLLLNTEDFKNLSLVSINQDSPVNILTTYTKYPQFGPVNNGEFFAFFEISQPNKVDASAFLPSGSNNLQPIYPIAAPENSTMREKWFRLININSSDSFVVAYSYNMTNETGSYLCYNLSTAIYNYDIDSSYPSYQLDVASNDLIIYDAFGFGQGGYVVVFGDLNTLLFQTFTSNSTPLIPIISINDTTQYARAIPHGSDAFLVVYNPSLTQMIAAIYNMEGQLKFQASFTPTLDAVESFSLARLDEKSFILSIILPGNTSLVQSYQYENNQVTLLSNVSSDSQVAVMSYLNGISYVEISQNTQGFSYQSYSVCPQVLYLYSRDCLTNYQYHSSPLNESLYYYLCVDHPTFSKDTFCCPSAMCAGCLDNICQCNGTNGDTLNATSNTCFQCPFATNCSVTPQGSLFINYCLLGFELLNNACCQPEAESCYYNSSYQLIAGSCKDPYVLANGVCCQPESQSCHLNSNGMIVTDSCEYNFYTNGTICCLNGSSACAIENGTIMAVSCDSANMLLYNGTCCPELAETCFLNTTTNEVIVTSCQASYVVFNSTCISCGPNCNSCTLWPDSSTPICNQCSNGNLIFNGTCVASCQENLTANTYGYCCPIYCENCGIGSTSCQNCGFPYLPYDEICCPPESETCHLNSNGLIITDSCQNNYYTNGSICCLDGSSACALENGSIVAVSCQDASMLIYNGTCCPKHAESCYLNNITNELIITSCQNTYVQYNNTCVSCGPNCNSCSLWPDSPTPICNNCSDQNFIFNGTCVSTCPSNLTADPEGYCCPVYCTSCGIGSEACDNCEFPYTAINGVCCPPECESCHLSTDGAIVADSCASNYYANGDLCCLNGSSACEIENGTVVATVCDNGGMLLINGLCCPERAETCYLNTTTNQLVVTSCQPTFIQFENTCVSCGSDCDYCTLWPESSTPLCQDCLYETSFYNGTCVRTCPDRLATNFEGYCCPLNCEDCGIGSTFCKNCLSGFSLLNNKECLQQCPKGYIDNDENICISAQALCEWVCDVYFLCEKGFFAIECQSSLLYLGFVIFLSMIFSLAKLILFMLIKDDSILIRLLKNHAYTDILFCFVGMVVINPEIMNKMSVFSILAFYGNLTGCIFTIEIFLYGYSKMKGSLFFENNFKKILLYSYFGSLVLEFINFYIMHEIGLSPYLIIGLGGLLVLTIDMKMFCKAKELNVGIDFKTYVLYPTILAISWGISSLADTGATLTDAYYWFSFTASILNYLQPVINTLLYAPIMIRAYRMTRQKKAESDQNIAERTVSNAEIEFKRDSVTYAEELTNALEL